jgi:hypothetical protein
MKTPRRSCEDGGLEAIAADSTWSWLPLVSGVSPCVYRKTRPIMSLIGTKRTCQAGLAMSNDWVDRKWRPARQTDAIDAGRRERQAECQRYRERGYRDCRFLLLLFRFTPNFGRVAAPHRLTQSALMEGGWLYAIIAGNSEQRRTVSVDRARVKGDCWQLLENWRRVRQNKGG